MDATIPDRIAGKDSGLPKGVLQDAENGLPEDRRLREDGFIILAQATIRADGFRPRKFGEGLRAARANPVQIFRIYPIRKI
jgi:hypothetical protein